MSDISKLTDEEVVKKICNYDKELFAEIIKRYQDKLMRYANYIVTDDFLAADVVQDSFIKAYINLKSFNTKKKFSSWIYRITHNEALNVIKKNKNNISFKETFDFDSGIDLSEEFTKDELVKNIKLCFSKMPLIYKEPLSLFYLEEKSYGEISDILRIPSGTVATRINRAKGIMKNICQNQKIKK